MINLKHRSSLPHLNSAIRLNKVIPRLNTLFASLGLIGLATFFCPDSAAIAAPVTQQDISQRPLEHKDYDRWNTIGQTTISNDGQWTIYSITSGKFDSDAILKIRQTNGSKEYTIVRGKSASFTFDSKFAIYRVAADPKVVKKLKKEKADAGKIPSDKLQLLELATGNIITKNRVNSFSTPEKNSQWLAFHEMKPLESDKLADKPSSINETYEVTPSGLRRPEKKLKLKKRESIEEEPLANETAKKESKTKKSEKKEAKSGTESESKKDDDDKKEKKPGTTLVLRNLETGFERAFPDVSSFKFSKFGDSLAFATSVATDDETKDSKDSKADDKKANAKKSDSKKSEKEEPTDAVFIFNLKSQTLKQVASATGNYSQLTFNDKGSYLAFLTDSNDYETKTPSWSLYLWKTKQKAANKIAHEEGKGVPEEWWVSSSARLVFTEDNRRLFFSTAPVPDEVLKEREDAKKEDAKKDDDDEPKAKLDIWHWQDPQLQPQQLLQANQERDRSYRAVYDLKKKKVIQLATKMMPNVNVDRRSKSNVAVSNSNYKYRKMMSWDIQAFQDTWFINLNNGERELVREKVRSGARISPNGNYVTWFDAEELKWFCMPTSGGGEPVEISKGIEFPLENELHDTPSLPRPYGTAGWLDDDEAVLIYDRFDIWQLDPTGDAKPICITEEFGRENNIRFRYVQLDPELRSIDPDSEIILSAFDQTSKGSGYFKLKLGEKEEKADDKEADDSNDDDVEAESNSRLQQLVMLDESVSRLRKARESNDVIFNRSSFRDSPDIWSSNLNFKKVKRLSDINPHQDEYTWGDVELVKWKSDGGTELEGLLYKPDGFDETKKYPLMVYFYERNSDNLHRYYAPAAGRSIINFSFYVSRGYVIFVPDIPYETGEPGPSAESAILPGVESIVKMGFIDEAKIGMQGHSWGGYQTAYLVTQTDMFACAESGAPVSNMTSAYGGIRWGSGMSRMFQYERTQSRIGEDLWSAREKYIANSPLFHADKINTPLLILHNDEDGAVPWYQGIELFVAMRRLEKPAWLLNYNEQPHWVMKPENRLDFAIRMQQFFDHYLLDAPEPEWMAVGVPAIDKGKKFGLELLEPVVEEEPEVETEPVAEEE